MKQFLTDNRIFLSETFDFIGIDLQLDLWIHIY